MSPVGPLTGNFRGTHQSGPFRVRESSGRHAGCRGPVAQQTDPAHAERSPKSVCMSPHAVAPDRSCDSGLRHHLKCANFCASLQTSCDRWQTPCDTASLAASADRLRCRAGFRARSAAQKPNTKTGPSKRSSALCIVTVAFHAATEFGQGKKIHYLSKRDSATVHTPPPSLLPSGNRVAVNSNRFCSISYSNPVFASS
jgi:hypothetical protein